MEAVSPQLTAGRWPIRPGHASIDPSDGRAAGTYPMAIFPARQGRRGRYSEFEHFALSAGSRSTYPMSGAKQTSQDGAIDG